ncbi:hypothetical protein AOC36_03680 [Erysipelothrix larvae]|uniref:Uncharacterized protein n=1 Tax=Erysipelothrix larvae TaxID=1514105 RepID=A0A120JTJ8_9FIRM|nr:hypothetical protein [Erysipelothrix larvae]AMC93108.1 hypothetical protein AOC36_03680 [Erysipelothrix larvae]
MKRLNKIWVPRSKGERTIAIIAIWIGWSVLTDSTENDVMVLLLLGLAIFLTYYSATQGSVELQAKDLAKKEKDAKIRKIVEAANAKAKAATIAKARLKYYGGGEIAGEQTVLVTVTKDRLDYGSYHIDMNAIISASIETQSQILSRVTLTRLAAFGFWALAIPKKKKSVEKFLSIDYNAGFQSTLIFGGDNIAKIHAGLIKAKKAR